MKNKITKKKIISKQRKKSTKRRNPIDTEFLRVDLLMSSPLGLPEDPIQAFKLGEQVGMMRMFKICRQGSPGDATVLLRKVEKRFDKNALNFIEESIPSDAFMLGLYSGILKAANICLKKAKLRTFLGLYGIGSTKIIDQIMEEIRMQPLYRQYYLPIETISTVKVSPGEYVRSLISPTPTLFERSMLPPSSMKALPALKK